MVWTWGRRPPSPMACKSTLGIAVKSAVSDKANVKGGHDGTERRPMQIRRDVWMLMLRAEHRDHSHLSERPRASFSKVLTQREQERGREAWSYFDLIHSAVSQLGSSSFWCSSNSRKKIVYFVIFAIYLVGQKLRFPIFASVMSSIQVN